MGMLKRIVKSVVAPAAKKIKWLAQHEPVLLGRLIATALGAAGSFWLDVDGETRALIVTGLVVLMGGEVPLVRGSVRPEADVKKRFRLKDLRG